MGANRFFWLSMTPLLWPVVPEVNMMAIRASRSLHSWIAAGGYSL